MKYNENTNGAQIILKMSLRTNDDGNQKKYESETKNKLRCFTWNVLYIDNNNNPMT